MSKLEEKTLKRAAVVSMFPQFEQMTPRQRTAFRKTCYYRQRMTPATLTLEEIAAIPAAVLWELCRVDWSTVSRWKSGKRAMPYSAQQLVRFVLYGHIPHGLGDWSGARFAKDGLLYAYNSAVGYCAGDLRGFYLVQEQASRVPGLLATITRLEKELAFHKAQTRDNSRLGFMRGLDCLLDEGEFSAVEGG